jgi:hypothetical protein
MLMRASTDEYIFPTILDLASASACCTTSASLASESTVVVRSRPRAETGHGAINSLPSGRMVPHDRDQMARRFSAEDLPVFRLATTSKETFCPSLRLDIPARSTALMCTNTSWLPSSGWMNPNPFWLLNHFTVPCVITTCLSGGAPTWIPPKGEP